MIPVLNTNSWICKIIDLLFRAFSLVACCFCCSNKNFFLTLRVVFKNAFYVCLYKLLNISILIYHSVILGTTSSAIAERPRCRVGRESKV